LLAVAEQDHQLRGARRENFRAEMLFASGMYANTRTKKQGATRIWLLLNAKRANVQCFGLLCDRAVAPVPWPTNKPSTQHAARVAQQAKTQTQRERAAYGDTAHGAPPPEAAARSQKPQPEAWSCSNPQQAAGSSR
jgi:hypothetical protein